MYKLTQQEAQNLLQKAYSMKIEYGDGLRLGQAIWNLIPKELIKDYEKWADSAIGLLFCGYQEEVDFFYEKDDNVSIEKFYKYFVK